MHLGVRWISRRIAFLALVLFAVAMLSAACGDDDDDDDGGATTPPAAAADGGNAPVALTIGSVLPETGTLGPLGIPIIAGVALAVADINAAGGDVTLLERDSGTDPDLATEAVNSLLAEGAHVILGAAASGVTQAFIQTLFDGEILQCSPSATSPSFSTQDNAGFFFRTVPPDEAVSPIIADEVVADGGTRVAIVARADDYGNALGGLVASSLDELGVDNTIILYDPASATFDSTVEEVVNYGPDAVVNIGFFFDGTGVIRGLLEAGITADIMYGSDGLFLPSLPGDVDPNDSNVLDGMKVFAASGGDTFNARLTEITDGNLIYGGQAYDCVILLTLAAQAAGSTDGADMLAALGNLTEGGTVCTSYEQCSKLLTEGEDIDYEGVSGPLNLDDVGDPTFGRYAVAQFQDGELVNIKSIDVDLTE